MIHSKSLHAFQREPLGGLVAAIHKARKKNPAAKPLPQGFIEHSQELPHLAETWVDRDFTLLDPMLETPVFRSRAAR